MLGLFFWILNGVYNIILIVSSAVIKIGGSILKKEPIVLEKILKTLKRIASANQITLIAGGGQLADMVRALQKRYKLSDSAVHWMAIITMDINGLLIAAQSKNAYVVKTISEWKKLSQSGKIPIFLPYQLLQKLNPLPQNWSVTSDSIALFLSHLLKADFTILVKDVDGIYRNIKKRQVIREISAKNVKQLHTSCVDSYLPVLVARYKRSVHIVSGLFPERIREILEGRSVLSTEIKP